MQCSSRQYTSHLLCVGRESHNSASGRTLQVCQPGMKKALRSMAAFIKRYAHTHRVCVLVALDAQLRAEGVSPSDHRQQYRQYRALPIKRRRAQDTKTAIWRVAKCAAASCAATSVSNSSGHVWERRRLMRWR
jgi:anti-sigma-K factor RskA